MESYFGLTADEWYEEFQKDGINSFSKRNIPDSKLIHILSRCCIGKEMIAPFLKISGWDSKRFIRAEIEYGIDEESLELVVGEYLVLDEFDYSEMNLLESRRTINREYSREYLSKKGAQALKNFRNFKF